MNQQEIDFLVKEYANLWKDLGVEDIEEKIKSPSLANRFLERISECKPATASQATPVPDVTPALKTPDTRTLEDVRTELGDCHRCPLCNERKSIVFGSGNPKTRLMFVGEGPGADEDMQGLPFIGRAGQLLTKIIEAMGYERAEFYIANVVKCRPPGNRTPEPGEIEQCSPFLRAQIEVIQPEFIIALGLCASTTLTGLQQTMGSLRGKFHPLQWNRKIEVMPTYHPAYLLRNPSAKKMVWDDVKLVKARLEANA